MRRIVFDAGKLSAKIALVPEALIAELIWLKLEGAMCHQWRIYPAPATP